MTDLAPGAVFAGCVIEEEAGRGGMSVVFRARQLALDRLVALKVIAPALAVEPGFRQRFEGETRIVASLEHPNVIPIYAAGEEEGRLFLVMRYVDGTDLHALVEARGRLEPAWAVEIVGQVGAALDAAQGRGVVHRDVKPANVLLAGSRPGAHVYLADFGLARAEGSRSGLTRTGQFVGTVDFVAPEQVEGRRIDGRADVYALGAVLHHALTGSVPYPRDTDLAVLLAHAHDPPPVPSALVPGLPTGLDAIVARAMAKDPADRFRTAGELAGAARQVVAALPPPAATVVGHERTPGRETAAATPEPPTTARRGPRLHPSPPQSPPPSPPARRRLLLPVLAGLAALVGAVIAVVLVAGGGDEGTSTQASGTARSKKTQRTHQTQTATEPSTPDPDPGGPEPAIARGILRAYVASYSSENLGGLGNLLTQDVVRNDSSGPDQRGIRAVLAVYRHQFARLKDPRYELTRPKLVAYGAAGESVSSRYSISDAGRQLSTGTISFVIRYGGVDLVERIDVEPDG